LVVSARPSQDSVNQEKNYLEGTKRLCTGGHSGQDVTIFCHRQGSSSNGETDGIKFFALLNDNGNGDGKALVTFRVAYFQNANDTTSVNDLHVKIFSVLEYTPASSSSIGYSSSATLKQEWTPSWTSWSGKVGSGYLEFQAVANTTSGTLTFSAYIATNDTFVGANHVALDANHVKFDVEIVNFPYEASSGSYLAVKTKVGTLNANCQKGNGRKSGSYTITNGNSALAGMFSFVDYVNLTSGTASIVHTSDTKYDYFAVSSSKPSYVLWDPMIGYEAADTSGAASAVGLSFVAFAAVVVGWLFL